MIATIEIFYHSISIISHRSHIWAEPNRSSASYLRQSLSTSILSSTTSHELREQLVLFPFVPYAISLSLSIAYREMRHNKLPVHRMRARAHFQASCRLLDGLEGKYCSAANAASMGKKMLREIDRVFSTVSSENRATAPHSEVTPNTFSNSTTNDHNPSSTIGTRKPFLITPLRTKRGCLSPHKSNSNNRTRRTNAQHPNKYPIYCPHM